MVLMTPDDDRIDISFDDSDAESASGADEERLDISFDDGGEDGGTGEEPGEPLPDVCPQCGYDLMPLETVCPRCGWKAGEATAAQAEEQPPADQPPQPVVIDSGEAVQEQQAGPQTRERPRGCRASPCLVVAGCLIILLAVVGGAVLIGVRALSQHAGEIGLPPTGPDGGAGGSVVAVTASNFETEVMEASLPVLVDFGADWCGPCRALEPVYRDLAAEFQGRVKFCSVDVEVSRQLGRQYVQEGIPTLVMFRSGRPVAKKAGFSGSKDRLRQWIEEAMR